MSAERPRKRCKDWPLRAPATELFFNSLGASKMTHLLNFVPERIQTRNMARTIQKAAILASDPFETPGMLDGSVTAMRRFLRDMAELTDDDDAGHGEPVLRLQFDDIVTVTSLLAHDNPPCLLVTALLPRDGQAAHSSISMQQPAVAMTAVCTSEALWDSDVGRYVMSHRIPLSLLEDEREVLDAILDVSDHAKAWMAAR